MVSSRNYKESLARRGYLGLNQVPSYIKDNWPMLSMSYPTVRQAVTDKALKVVEIGNAMRVTEDDVKSFITLVEEGKYFPSSSPQVAHWRLTARPD